jgi:hypothetical protein
MTDHAKAAVACELIRCTGSIDKLAKVATAVRSIADEQVREELQVALYPTLMKQSIFNFLYTALPGFHELIQMDVERRPAVLQALLNAFESTGIEKTAELSDQVAVLTFQADPDGKLLRPGTQRRDKANLTNTDYLVGGEPFAYPDELAIRRAVLQDKGSSIIEGRVAAEIVSTPFNVAVLAQLAADYVGRPVQPSDWPELLTMLQPDRLQS